MFSLDDNLFEETYLAQNKKMNFNEIFKGTYIPLLNYIGVLWQTKGVKPSQEHFISNLIYQKIALNIASIPKPKTQTKRVNVLFLPEGEVHEIGLFFLMYHLKMIGERTIYLGSNIPTDDLIDIKSQFQEINWICYFLTGRTDEEKIAFVEEMEGLLLNTRNTCRVVGNFWGNYSAPNLAENITFYEGFEQLISE